MSAPIDMMLSGVTWVEIPRERDAMHNGDIPYATHSGSLELFGQSLRVYRLSNGNAVIHADDMAFLFGEVFPAVSNMTPAAKQHEDI